MSKKNSIIIILVIFLLILGGLLFFYFYNGKNQVVNKPVSGDTTSNPFGSNTTNRTSSTTQSSGRDYDYTINNKKIATLRQLYAYPNSGAVLLEKSGTTFARLVDRATGNIHEVAEDSEEIKRVTNTTVPKILEAIWSSVGDSLILRYSVNDPEKLDNFSAKIKVDTKTNNEFAGEITGKVVAQNADSIITNSLGNKIFSITKRGDMKGSYGIVSSLDGAGSREIFDSEISEWLTSWPKSNTIALVTKPSYKQYGYLFFLNTDNGSLDKIFGSAYGLNVLINKEATAFVYSNSSRGSVRLNYYDIKSGTDKNLQLATLADKCVWGNKDTNIVYCAVPKSISNGNYPDAWYQGVASFSDNFWKIDIDKGTTKLIYETGANDTANIDVMDLRISNNDDFLIFTDKNNLSLWGLQILK